MGIQQRNNNRWVGAIAPILLIMAILWLYPVADIKDPRFSAYFRFETVVVILFSIVLWQINKWIAAFLLLAFVSSIIPFSTKFSTDAFLAVLFGLFWFYVLSKYVKPDQVKYLLDAICILAICNVGLLIAQHFGFDPIFKARPGQHGTPVVGFLSNRNEVSAFLAFALPAFFRARWKWFVPIVFIGLTIAKSTGGPLAVIIMVYVYFLLKDKQDGLRVNFVRISAVTIWFIFFISYIDCPVQINTETVISQATMERELRTSVILNDLNFYGWTKNPRLWAWKTGIELHKQHLWLGSGMGHWKVVFSNIRNPWNLWWKHAHNEFVQGLFEMGILFPVLMIGYLMGIVRKYRREAILPATALGIIIINSCFNFPFHIAQAAILALTWMAILQVQLQENNYPMVVEGKF